MNKIALLNDNFRVTFLGGQVVMTAGVNELPLDVKALALLKTQRFKDFTEDNDHMNNTTSAASKSAAIGSSGKSTTTTTR
jgi:hypothetical protein